jgi:hypothetical protein
MQKQLKKWMMPLPIEHQPQWWEKPSVHQSVMAQQMKGT